MSFFRFVPLLAIFGLHMPMKVLGHMAMYHPSAYGFMEEHGPLHDPLVNLTFNEWWFHGYQDDTPAEVMVIPAGKPLTVGISCRKAHSLYGEETSEEACPSESGSYHAGGPTKTPAGWGENDPAQLLGCALAIAPKANASSTNPEDFIVMSIQETCVRTRDTVFDIPANLPECPDGECTCAWFWQGKDAQNEMYQVGFRCRVEGGVMGFYPKPVPPRKGEISGPTQPMYWANTDSNLDPQPQGRDDRPSYNSAWGWVAGAQTSSFAEGDVSGPVTPVEIPMSGEEEAVEVGGTRSATVGATSSKGGMGGEITQLPNKPAPTPIESDQEEGTEKEEDSESAVAPTPTARRKGRCGRRRRVVG